MPESIDKDNEEKSQAAANADDPLAILHVFDRLEVGPVQLEPKRLAAPYRLYRNGKAESSELIYSYEESVFEPSEPESQNLADMIAAQAALNHAAQMINRDAHIFVCVDTGETSDVDISEFVETPNDVHAGEIETSTTLAVRPRLVKMDQARPAIPEFSSRYLDFISMRGVLWYAHTRKISKSGVMGDPTKADAAKGRKIWEIMIAHLVALVEDLKYLTLDEIHHRNY